MARLVICVAAKVVGLRQIFRRDIRFARVLARSGCTLALSAGRTRRTFCRERKQLLKATPVGRDSSGVALAQMSAMEGESPTHRKPAPPVRSSSDVLYVRGRGDSESPSARRGETPRGGRPSFADSFGPVPEASSSGQSQQDRDKEEARRREMEKAQKKELYQPLDPRILVSGIEVGRRGCWLSFCGALGRRARGRPARLSAESGPNLCAGGREQLVRLLSADVHHSFCELAAMDGRQGGAEETHI